MTDSAVLMLVIGLVWLGVQVCDIARWLAPLRSPSP